MLTREDNEETVRAMRERGLLQDYHAVGGDRVAHLLDTIDELRARLVLRPIEEARKDGTPYLVVLKNDETIPDHARQWRGVIAVMKHPGIAADGFDIGWVVDAPVGAGGFRDDAIAGFVELPEGILVPKASVG